jgi:hypothetical protein
MKAEQIKDNKSQGAFAIGTGVLVGFFCLMMFGVFVLSVSQNQWPENCVISPENRVTPTKNIDGVVKEAISSVFVHSNESGDHVLGVCAKGGCSNKLPRLLSGKHGEDIHVEYCGQKLTRVVFEGQEVYVALPEGKNSNVIFVLAISFLIVPLVIILHGIFLTHRVKRETVSSKN